MRSVHACDTRRGVKRAERSERSNCQHARPPRVPFGVRDRRGAWRGSRGGALGARVAACAHSERGSRADERRGCAAALCVCVAAGARLVGQERLHALRLAGLLHLQAGGASVRERARNRRNGAPRRRLPAGCVNGACANARAQAAGDGARVRASSFMSTGSDMATAAAAATRRAAQRGAKARERVARGFRRACARRSGKHAAGCGAARATCALRAAARRAGGRQRCAAAGIRRQRRAARACAAH
jgi:hypothetical protein